FLEGKLRFVPSQFQEQRHPDRVAGEHRVAFRGKDLPPFTGEFASESAAASEEQNPARRRRGCLRGKALEIGRRQARATNVEDGGAALLPAVPPGDDEKRIGFTGKPLAQGQETGAVGCEDGYGVRG